MPCGTGKTVTILSFLLAYKKAHPASLEKIIYCTRTVPELTKVVEELRDLVQFYADNGEHLDILSMSLSSRQNLCVNSEVTSCGGRIEIDTECRRRTATFARRNAKMSPSPENPSCSYFENLENSTLSAKLPRTIYNLEDIKNFGKVKITFIFAYAKNLYRYFLMRGRPKTNINIFLRMTGSLGMRRCRF